MGEIKEQLKSPFHRRMYHDYWAEILNRIGYVAIARNYLRNPGLLEHFDYASIEHRIVGIVGASSLKQSFGQICVLNTPKVFKTSPKVF